MLGSQGDQPSKFDAADLGQKVRRSLPIALVIALAAGLLTFGVLSLTPSRHTAESRMAIKTQEAKTVATAREDAKSAAAAAKPVDATKINTHLRALADPKLLSKVAGQLRLAERSEFGGSDTGGLVGQVMQLVGLGGQEPRAAASSEVIARVKQRLTIAPVADNRFIVVRFVSGSAPLSMAFVDRLTKTYQKSLVGHPFNETKQEIDELVAKTANLKSEVAAANAEAEQIRAKINQLRSGSSDASVNHRRLVELKAKLVEAQATKSQAESKWRNVRELMQQGKVSAVPELQKSPVIRRLVAQRSRQERQLANAQRTLLPAHPRLKRLRADVARVKRTIHGELLKFVRGLEKEFRTVAFRVEDLEREVAELNAKAIDTTAEEGRLSQLQSRAASKRSELEQVQRELEGKMILVVNKPPADLAQIVVPAKLVGGSGVTEKAPYTLLAMAVSFVLGLALIMAKELLLTGNAINAPSNKGEIRTSSVPSATVGARLNLPTAEENPVPNTEPHPEAASIDEPIAAKGDVFEHASVAGIADHLLDLGQDVSGFRSILIGEHDGIDPSEPGMELANSLSRSGAQVVVVDWNVKADRFGPSIGVGERPGLTELLYGEANFEDVIGNVPGSRVHYINAGAGLDVQGYELDDEGLNLVLDALDEAYDHIVVVGRFDAAQLLFEVIQGRFDAGIVVCERNGRVDTRFDPAGTFLGFEVMDIDIIHYVRQASPAFAMVDPAPVRQMERV